MRFPTSAQCKVPEFFWYPRPQTYYRISTPGKLECSHVACLEVSHWVLVLETSEGSGYSSQVTVNRIPHTAVPSSAHLMSLKGHMCILAVPKEINVTSNKGPRDK